jgi:class 3 adenylate cyclase
MEPQIQYCTTSDGVSIAYCATGEGKTIVDMGHPPTHAQMEWRLPLVRAWYERFARHHRYVRFDTRGCGLSERNITEYSLDTMVRDAEAVIDDLGCETVTLIGGMNSGAPAIAYAAAHPERVDQLVLWCAYSKGSEFFDDPGTKALRDMVDRDWHMLTETASRSRFSWKADDHASEYAALWRAAVTPRVQGMLMDGLAAVDVTPLLKQVRAPTLVLHREDRGVDLARRIAAGIPGAKVALFAGGSAAPYLPDADDVWRAIAEFLGDDPAPANGRDETIRTILFTDVESNTALLQRLGDDAWRAVLHEYERMTRGQIAAHGGTEIKTMGDGFMASFGSAARALECAIAMQRAFDTHRAGAEHAVRVRIGLNAGEPIAEDDPGGRADLFGTAVTTAARIMGQAQGGEILVSDVVRQLVAGKGFEFADRGEIVLRGFDDPVRVYELRIPE